MISPSDYAAEDNIEPLHSDNIKPLKQAELYQLWRNRVVKDDNDLIVCIAASSRTEISGTGKSTLAIQLARIFDHTTGGFDATTKATLSAGKVARDLYPNLPSQSSILFDEAQGTIADDGVDSRRAMSHSVVEMSRAAAQYRKRQHSLVIVSQSTDWIDSRMMDLIDRLILIQRKNVDEGWARAVSFDHYKNDLPSRGGSKERTPAIEDIFWEPLPDNDPDYLAIEELKEQAGDLSSDSDEDEDNKLAGDFADLPKGQRDELMRQVYEHTDTSQSRLADLTDLDQGTVSRILRDES